LLRIVSIYLSVLIYFLTGVPLAKGMVVYPDRGSGTTRDIIDPSGKLLIRIKPGGAKTYYIYGLGLLYEIDDAAIPKTKTYHFDQVGSTLVRTDDAGKIIGQAEYSAYGILTWKSGDMATPFLYNGQAGVQTDPNGLLNMRARYYSPYLMRFLNADPIGFSGGSNWFAYADGNPISMSDPFGLCPDRNLCTGGTGRGGVSTMSPGQQKFVSKAIDIYTELIYGDEDVRFGKVKMFDMGLLSYITPVGGVGAAGKVANAAVTAESSIAAPLLRNQLAGQEIAGGHAFAKHAGEFGFTNSGQMATHVENVMTNPSAMRNLSGGRTAFWDNASQSVIIRNPSAVDGGTAFKPASGISYFNNLR
jgi:RHS repeat-associated protein